jgi:N-acetylglucosamine-6-phosphate deacetylase
MRAFLYHFHGLGDIDFSSLEPEDLPRLQAMAGAGQLEIVPTVYLRPTDLPRLVRVMKAYSELRAGGYLPNIAGFAIEGPLLGPQGGIPRSGRWYPTVPEWRTLSDLGPLGLRYIVMAPDAMELDGRIDGRITFADLLTSFYNNGVRIAVGHFHRDDPARSAARLRRMLDFLHSSYVSSPYLVLTDHLYNDMPRNFQHAWRTAQEQQRRATEVGSFLAHDWETSDLSELLGDVPAATLAAAREGLLMPCLNFDGYHVDLDICRRTVDYLGPQRLVVITDSTEVDVMADERLTLDPDSGLWRRDDGAVAAGSSGYDVQSANMRRIGLDEDTIATMFLTNPHAAIAFDPVPAATAADGRGAGTGDRSALVAGRAAG